MVDDACCHLCCYTSTYGASNIMGSRPWPFWGHVTSSVTWPFDSRGSTSYGWFIVTMRLSSTVMEIRPFEFLPGRLFQEQRSVVGRFSILHWSQIRSERSARGVKNLDYFWHRNNQCYRFPTEFICFKNYPSYLLLWQKNCRLCLKFRLYYIATLCQ